TPRQSGTRRVPARLAQGTKEECGGLPTAATRCGGLGGEPLMVCKGGPSVYASSDRVIGAGLPGGVRDHGSRNRRRPFSGSRFRRVFLRLGKPNRGDPH